MTPAQRRELTDRQHRHLSIVRVNDGLEMSHL